MGRTRHGVKGLGRFLIGRSVLEYIPGEETMARHARRRDFAVANLPAVRAWCEHRGVEFNLIRTGDHPHGTTFKFRVFYPNGAACAGWIPGLGRAWRTDLAGTPRLKELAKMDDYQQLLTWLEPWAERATAKAAAPNAST